MGKVLRVRLSGYLMVTSWSSGQKPMSSNRRTVTRSKPVKGTTRLPVAAVVGALMCRRQDLSEQHLTTAKPRVTQPRQPRV